jgi:hypothetical protein
MPAKKSTRRAAAPKSTARRQSGAEGAMVLEYLLVHFGETRMVLADGNPVGVTNHILVLQPGSYAITLSGSGYSPTSAAIDLFGTSVVQPKVVVFT